MARSPLPEPALRAFGFERIAGVDEAGRGPLAGPVVASAVVLPRGMKGVLRIDDSKKLSPKLRSELFCLLMRNRKVAVGIGVVEAAQIDELGIHFATLEAMRLSLSELGDEFDFALIDGKFVPQIGRPIQKPIWALVGGDGLCQSVGAASIVAKCVRDQIMQGYDTLYPGYGFAAHKGYGTREHCAALEKMGPCPIHRKSFQPVKEQVKRQ